MSKTIGGNGFQNLDTALVSELERDLSLIQLHKLNTKLSRQISALQNTIDTLPAAAPVAIQETLRAELLAIGEKLNDLTGAVGAAHDNKLETKVSQLVERGI